MPVVCSSPRCRMHSFSSTCRRPGARRTKSGLPGKRLTPARIQAMIPGLAGVLVLLPDAGLTLPRKAARHRMAVAAGEFRACKRSVTRNRKSGDGQSLCLRMRAPVAYPTGDWGDDSTERMQASPGAMRSRHCHFHHHLLTERLPENYVLHDGRAPAYSSGAYTATGVF